MTTALTNAQQVILSAAANQPEGRALPLPTTLTLNRASSVRVLKSLIAKGYLAEYPAHRHDALWREADENTEESATTLVITQEGLGVLGIEPEESDKAVIPLKNDTTVTAPATVKKQKNETKQTGPFKLLQLIQLLARPEGASLTEMAEVTGWQHHSLRGVMSGQLKKKRNLVITSESHPSRGRIYRLAIVQGKEAHDGK